RHSAGAVRGYRGVSALAQTWPLAARSRHRTRQGPLPFLFRPARRARSVFISGADGGGAVRGVHGVSRAGHQRRRHSGHPDASTPVPLDQAVAAAAPVFPGARLSRVYLPRSQRDSYRLAYVLPESNWQRYAASSVWVDQYSGEILEVWDERKLGAADTVLAWQFPLHNGEALGLPGRWLVFVSGGLPALLFVTGVYLWWRKRRLKRRR